MQLLLNPAAIVGVLKDVQGTEFILHADGTIALLANSSKEWTQDKDGKTYFEVVFNLADASEENRQMLTKVLGHVTMGVAKNVGSKQSYFSPDPKDPDLPAKPPRFPPWVLPTVIGVGAAGLILGGFIFLRRRR